MKVKPCPFCGSSEIRFISEERLPEWSECQNCFAAGPCVGNQCDWNTRPREHELIQALEELSKQVTKWVLSSVSCPKTWDSIMDAIKKSDKVVERMKSE